MFGAVPVVPIGNQVPNMVEDSFFTRNSIRRDPKADDEKNAVIQVTTNIGSCVGFFVANKENKPYVATGRHCADYLMTDWCKSTQAKDDGNYSIGYPYVSDDSKSRIKGGHCNRVVAGTVKDDIVIIEVSEPPSDVKDKMRFLRLAGFCPEVGDTLKMIGKPGDNERDGKLTVTEKCWDNTGGGIYAGTRILNTRVITESEVQNKKNKKMARLLDKKYRYNNCSTYAGNSGGPIFLEGTNQVVGMPEGYVPEKWNAKDHKYYSSENSMPYETTCGFVARRENREALKKAGILIDWEPDFKGSGVDTIKKDPKKLE